MTAEERAAVEELLAAERGRVAATEAGLVGELAAIVEASDRANLDDEHDPEGSTVAYERARVASLLDAVHQRSVDLAAAVDRLRAGTYGRCEHCGQPIAAERLAAYPTALACVSCANG
jgi:RNA polymerase-binding transcription factor DksA